MKSTPQPCPHCGVPVSVRPVSDLAGIRPGTFDGNVVTLDAEGPNQFFRHDCRPPEPSPNLIRFLGWLRAQRRGDGQRGLFEEVAA